MKKFHGSIVALVTPFKDGKLDEKSLERMVEWHIQNGTNAIVPTGTTGDCPTLTHEEHIRVIEIVVQVAAGRIPVMAGASLLKVLKYDGTMAGNEIMILIVGMIVAFVVSVAVIRFLMSYIRRHDFKVFGVYRIVLGLVVLIYFGMR